MKFLHYDTVAATCGILLSMLGATAPTGAAPKPVPPISITSTPGHTDWNQPTLLIPQLPAAPAIDGMLDADVWTGATRAEYKFALGSNRAVAADARFRVGHRNGTLFLFCEYDRRPDEKVVATAGRHGAVWNDDGGELFFSRINDIGDARQLLFNLAGAHRHLGPLAG